MRIYTLTIIVIFFTSQVAFSNCESRLSTTSKILSMEFYTYPELPTPEGRQKSALHRLALILEDAGFLLPRSYIVLPRRMSAFGAFRLAETRNTEGVFLRPQDVRKMRSESPAFYFREVPDKIILMQRQSGDENDLEVMTFEIGEYRQIGIINATTDPRPAHARYFVGFEIAENRVNLFSLQDRLEEWSVDIKPSSWPSWQRFIGYNFGILIRTDHLVHESDITPATQGRDILRPAYIVDPSI